MLVLGRTSVAPPAPVNTLSLKSENRVHNNVHGSLVPAGSNWAENTEEMLEKEVSEDVSHADHEATVTAVSDKVWTRQSVAEHLHPSSSTVSIANSGRWGDDAVENDIVQKNLCCQIQQESTTRLADETQSSTGSSSNSPSKSNVSQQVQLLTRPKMLFDPKTGGIVSVESMMGPDKQQRERLEYC
ncbi:unnamed protein product [Peronospora belbahrii]|uniref:Uncharacterized protein n=1 Tax=Peronospora belbahrii TaxID=622444 RepID=A0ABN8CZ63_9STRA|nr:unnamed protein product [Peronospora belbahrii]